MKKVILKELIIIKLNEIKNIAYVKDVASNNKIIVRLCNENHGALFIDLSYISLNLRGIL